MPCIVCIYIHKYARPKRQRYIVNSFHFYVISFYIYYLVPNEGIYYYVPFDGYITLSHLKSLLLSRQMKAGHLAVIAKQVPVIGFQACRISLKQVRQHFSSFLAISFDDFLKYFHFCMTFQNSHDPNFRFTQYIIKC